MGVFLGGEPDSMVARLDGGLVMRVELDGVVGFKQWPTTTRASESMEEIV